MNMEENIFLHSNLDLSLHHTSNKPQIQENNKTAPENPNSLQQNQHTTRSSSLDTKLNIDEKEEDEEIPLLRIVRFGATPWINFGCAKFYPGSPIQPIIKRVLNIENPGDQEETLEIEKMNESTGFSVEQKTIIVPAKKTIPLTFQWQPTSIGNARENITFKGSGFRLRASLFATGTQKLGTVERPIKVEIMAGKGKDGSTQILTSTIMFKQETDDPDAIERDRQKAQQRKQQGNQRATVFHKSSNQQSSSATPSRSNNGPISRLASKSLEQRTPSQKSTAIQPRMTSSNSLEIKTPSKRFSQLELKTPSRQVPQRSQKDILQSVANGMAKKFASNGRWMEKEQTAFCRWLNFVLLNEDDSSSSTNDTSNLTLKGMASIMDGNHSNPSNKVTPRQMSFLKKKAAVRQAARTLLHSSEASIVLGKLKNEISSKKLLINSEKFIYADFGLRQQVTDLLLNYAPHHLHLALETLFGEVIPGPNSNVQNYIYSLEMILAKFITKRVLFDENIAAQFEGTVKELYKPGFKEALDQVVLMRFFTLVWLLDRMKLYHILDDNSLQGISNFHLHTSMLSSAATSSTYNSSCLFKKSSTIKSSPDMICTFGTHYLVAEGNILRRMSLIGYVTHHQQTYLDEFDFSVTSLAADLRDGVRLSRLAEILGKKLGLKPQQCSVLPSLRVPAISRLQKIHNVTKALEKFHQCGVAMPDLEARDIVDGKQSKTLAFLWNVIYQAHLSTLINASEIIREVERITVENLVLKIDAELKRKNNLKSSNSYFADQTMTADSDPTTCIYFNNELFSAILKWSQVICSRYGIPIQNFTSSFSDGRAFCAIIHCYAPELLDFEQVKQNTSLKLEEAINSVVQKEDGDVSESSFDGMQNLESLPLSPGPIDGNWIGVFSPPSGTSDALRSLLEAEKHNYTLVQSAVKKIGFVPNLVSAFDMSNTLPDEKVVVTFLTFLCSRLIEIVEERKATITIQRAFRSWYNRSSHVRESRSTLVLQKHIKGWKQRKQFKKMVEAGTTLVKAFESAIHTKKHRQFVSSVTLIQSSIRAFLVRNRLKKEEEAAIVLQSHIRRYLQATNFIRLKHAAVTIQSAIRARNACIKVERERAAIKIQSWWRMVLARKAFVSLETSALRLQAWWRMALEQRRISKLTESAVVLQTAIRSWSAKRTVSEFKVAISMLQATFRMRTQFTDYQKTKNAALVIQTAYRCYQARKDLEMRKSVVTIQTWARMALARKQYLEQKEACIKIQNAYRSHVQRQIEKKNQAALKIQSWWRMILAKHDFRRKNEAALKIQSWWRMVLARKRFRELEAAALEIQTQIRARSARIRVERIRAALKIQSWWRMVLVRKEFKRKEEAAIKIQKWWREVLEKKEFARQTKAALKIQSWWRMVIARRNYQQMKNASLKIQSWYRMVTAQDELRRRKEAILTIQKWCHMVIAKKEYERKIEAAIKVQSWWRMVLVRKQIQAMECAALKVQRWWRTVLARRRLLEMNSAALKIQSWWRMVSARKRFRKLEAAALEIQTQIRARSARIRVERIRAALKIQSWWRMVLVRKEFKRKEEAAIKIQIWWREVLRQRELKRQNEAAITIQSWWRKVLVRKKVNQWRDAALKVQQSFRAFKTRQALKRLSAAATVIQSIVKGHQQRIRFETMKKGIVTIQSMIRSKVVQRQFESDKSKIIKIQTCARAFLAKKQHEKDMASVVLIQSQVRAFLARRDHEQNKNKIIRLQALVRSFTTRKRLEREKAAKSLAVVYKSYKLRQNVAALSESLQLISSASKAYSARMTYAQLKHGKLLEATLFVQRRFREKRALKEKMTTENAILRIQAAYKGWRVRRNLKLARIAVLRKKIEHSSVNTPISQSMGYQTNLALKTILEGQKLSDIVSACTILEQSTRYSDKCALYVIEVEAIKILFGVMETCNRSAPHISVIKIILDVVIHILSWTTTRSGLVSQQPDVLERLVNIMYSFKDVPEVFTRAATAFVSIVKPLPEVAVNWLNGSKNISALNPSSSSSSSSSVVAYPGRQSLAYSENSSSSTNPTAAMKLNLGRLVSLEEHALKRLNMDKKAKKININASQESYQKILDICNLCNHLISKQQPNKK